MSFLAEQEAAEKARRPRWVKIERDVTASLGGGHELHRFIGRWGGGDVGEWVELREAATGETLLDMSGIKSAKVAWRADGALLVRIEAYSDARLLIVDPEIRTFRDIGIDPAPRPIGELQSAVATAAWELGADGGERHPRDPYLERDFSPDGGFMVEYAIEPQRMSHETRVPRLIDVATGDTVLTMPSSLYDASVAWRDDSRAQLRIRRYDDGALAWLDVDCAARTFTRPGESDGPRPLSKLGKEIVRATERSTVSEQPRPIPAQREWGNTLGVLMVILLLLGGIALGSWYFTEPGKQQLTPLPKFPPPHA
jgi:hypothetical protein